MLALKASAEGSLKLPIAGEEKLRKSANQLGINTEGETILTDPQRLPIKINNACIGAKK
jgi:carbon-monoxide dehydrogenase catalytic subunit